MNTFKTFLRAFLRIGICTGAVLCLFCSCDLAGGERIRISLPGRPQNWPRAGYQPQWTVRYLNESGKVQTLEQVSGPYCDLNPGHIPFIVALACPQDGFRPAGICAQTGSGSFCWADGAAAEFFLSLAELYQLLFCCDLPVIAEKFREKAGFSPWQIDTVIVKAHLLAGTLNGNLFRNKDTYVLETDCSAICGCWDPEMDYLCEEGLVCISGKNVFYTEHSVITVLAGKDGWRKLEVFDSGVTDVSFGSW